MNKSAGAPWFRNVVMSLAGVLLLVLTTCGAGHGGPEAGSLQPGVLEGTVTIGPLCPVEPCQITPEELAETYATRKVIVYNAERSSVIKELSLDKTGKYKTELIPGQYIVDINHAGMDRSSDVPKAVIIESARTTIVNISIDTGLR